MWRALSDGMKGERGGILGTNRSQVARGVRDGVGKRMKMGERNQHLLGWGNAELLQGKKEGHIPKCSSLH